MVETPTALKTWKAETTAIDRVQSIATTVSEPQPAASIAEEALVTENTARAHLQRLVDWNILVERDRDAPAVYAPDSLHTRMQTIRLC
jgi:predicted ArsR family transcriptional regulator